MRSIWLRRTCPMIEMSRTFQVSVCASTPWAVLMPTKVAPGTWSTGSISALT
jgi:hypothetical protein